MPRRTFARYLEDSLDPIERHVPGVYALVLESLGHRTLRLEVSGESLSLKVDRGRIAIGPPRHAEDIVARTTRTAIVALAHGEATLEQAAIEERVHLRGTVEDLAAGMDALAAYLNGAARCPELLDLMDAFRADAAEGTEP